MYTSSKYSELEKAFRIRFDHRYGRHNSICSNNLIFVGDNWQNCKMLNHLKANKQILRMREFKRSIVHEISVDSRSETFSQHGEDSFLESLFEGERGMYVDVGCSLPRKFSNTYLFYIRGWRGIAIDANLDLKLFWKVLRSQDRFVNAAISYVSLVDLRIMEHGFSTTVDNEYSDFLVFHRNKKIVSRKIMEGIELQTILERYVDSITPEDACFMSIDVEMHDFNVLVTNDWNRFKPRAICIETGDDPASVRALRISELLQENQYRNWRQVGMSSIFVHERFFKC